VPGVPPCFAIDESCRARAAGVVIELDRTTRTGSVFTATGPGALTQVKRRGFFASLRSRMQAVNTPATLFDKLWAEHLVRDLGGGVGLLAIDRVFLHERTGSIALKGLAEAGRAVADPARVFCTMDHIVDTLPGRGDDTLMPGGKAFIVETRAAARTAGIRVFDVRDPDQGIVHVIAPELGIVLPGATVVCPDSHTCTQGALGALAWGIGSTEAEHALATGTLRVTRPKTMRVTFNGRLPRGVTAKDLSLALLGRHGAVGGNGCAIEYAGAAVRDLDVEARLTLCNMATEFSAMTGLIAPDEQTFAYLAGRRYAPAGANWEAAVAHWRTLATDDGARFDREIELAADELAPMVTWGTSPQHAARITDRVPAQADSGTSREAYARALAYMGSNLECNCSRSRSAQPSSARAPTAASPTCAAPRACCAGAALRRECGPSACRAR